MRRNRLLFAIVAQLAQVSSTVGWGYCATFEIAHSNGGYWQSSTPISKSTTIDYQFNGEDYAYGMVGFASSSAFKNWVTTDLRYTAYAEGRSFIQPVGSSQATFRDQVIITGGSGTGILRSTIRTIGRKVGDGLASSPIDEASSEDRIFQYGMPIFIGASASAGFGLGPISGIQNARYSGRASAQAFVGYSFLDVTGSIEVPVSMTSAIDQHVYPVDKLRPGWEAVLDEPLTIDNNGNRIVLTVDTPGFTVPGFEEFLGVKNITFLNQFSFPEGFKVFIYDETTREKYEIDRTGVLDPMPGGTPSRYYIVRNPRGIESPIVVHAEDAGFYDDEMFYYGQSPDSINLSAHISSMRDANDRLFFVDQPMVPPGFFQGDESWEFVTRIVGRADDGTMIRLPGRKTGVRWKSNLQGTELGIVDGELTVIGHAGVGLNHPVPGDSIGGVFDVEFIDDLAVMQGDFDLDGDTDGADFLQWQRSVGSNRLSADGNADGLVDSRDLAIWQNVLSSSNLDSSGEAIPEPTSNMLCGFYISVLLFSSCRTRWAVERITRDMP